MMLVVFFVLGAALGWFVSKYFANGASAALQLEQRELLKENGRLQAISEHRERDLLDLQKKFQTEFENVSTKIFKENVREFSESSKSRIEEILSPLKQKMDTFQANLQEVSKVGTAERLTLKCKIDMMADCSKILAEETSRLTKTLKGDVKKQGTWGELILQKVLESSGLRENIEYTLQGTGLGLSNDEGRRMQPDVIINLPDDKKIIVDSKMSYLHYDEYLNKTSESEKKECLKKLTLSLKDHVRDLSEKNYSSSKKLDNPDFVLLFVPIEAIFSLVIEKEPSLFEEAWKKSIIIVSPTNILAILRTIESIWKTERQNKNTLKIAEDAASLYDKFVDFLKDLENTQKYMQNANEHFEKAFSKLSSGRGNLIKRTEDLKKLGLKTKKQIPDTYLEDELVVTQELR
jgi:DNA recombination protein RmuC